MAVLGRTDCRFAGQHVPGGGRLCGRRRPGPAARPGDGREPPRVFLDEPAGPAASPDSADRLGSRINEAREYFWSDKIIAGMIIIGLLALAIDLAMNKLNNYLLRWHRGLEH